MIRAFVAIPLPKDTVAALEDIQADLRVGRPTAPGTFHVTLAYLDKQTELTLERVHEVLNQIKLPPFEIQVTGIDVFGGAQPRVIWAGIETNHALEALRERVRRAAMRSDVELSRERFRPHVTLARLKGQQRPSDTAKLQEFLQMHSATRLPAFSVDRFTLYRSTLHHGRAQHDPMVSYTLAH